MEIALIVSVVAIIAVAAMIVVGGWGWNPYGGERGPHFASRPWEGVWLLLVALVGGCVMLLAIPIGSSAWRTMAPLVAISGLAIVVSAVSLYIRRR